MEEFKDPEYNKLKKDIQDRSYSLNIKSTIAAMSFLAAAALGVVGFMAGSEPASLSITTGVITPASFSLGATSIAAFASAAVLGTVSLATGINSYHERVGLELDVKDLDAQRRAKHLKASFGDKSPNSDLLKMMENGQQDAAEAQQKWIVALEQERAAQHQQIRTGRT